MEDRRRLKDTRLVVVLAHVKGHRRVQGVVEKKDASWLTHGGNIAHSHIRTKTVTKGQNTCVNFTVKEQKKKTKGDRKPGKKRSGRGGNRLSVFETKVECLTG